MAENCNETVADAFQKHSLGGLTIDMPTSVRRAHTVSPRDNLLFAGHVEFTVHIDYVGRLLHLRAILRDARGPRFPPVRGLPSVDPIRNFCRVQLDIWDKYFSD